MWTDVVERKVCLSLWPGKGLLPSSLLPALPSGVARLSVYPVDSRLEWTWGQVRMPGVRGNGAQAEGVGPRCGLGGGRGWELSVARA